ncbi:MAG: radical SAM protein [Desulfobacteraceae bacterium]
MRILLVNPSSGNTFRSLGIVPPPLGLLYIAAAVRRSGHQVKIFDGMVEKPPIAFSGCDVVGIYCDTTRFSQVMDLARRAKSNGCRVVLGGPHPCFDAPTIMATGWVDAIVRGEGERSFVKLLESWQYSDTPEAMAGVIVHTPDGIVDGGPARHIHDLDNLPLPARDLIDLPLYAMNQLQGRPFMSMHTSRGCPFQCRFCASTQIDGATWRARSAESVLDELEHVAVDLGYGAVSFMDDNFTGSKKRIHEICDGILSRGLDLKWWCFCRVDTIVRHPDMIAHMARAGAATIFIGVESPNAWVLDGNNKGTRSHQAREAVRILKSLNIEICASYILGFPQERPKDIRATIRFARELDTDTAQFTILTPYPGTVLWEELEERLLYRSGHTFDGMHAVFRHPHIGTTHEMQLWHLWAYLSYYLRSRKSIQGFFRFLRNRKKRLQTVTAAVGN